MIDAQGSAVEAALWTALEVLEERGELLRRIATRMDAQPRDPAPVRPTERRERRRARGGHPRAPAQR